MRLQLLRKLRSLADTYKQHAGRQRVQRAGMSDLKVLLAEMTDSRIFDFADDIRRSPSVWFVNRDDNPLRIVLDVSRKRSHIRSKNQSFQDMLFYRDFIDATLVATTLEFFTKPCVSDFQNGLERDEACRHHEYIGVVVLLDQLADLH